MPSNVVQMLHDAEIPFEFEDQREEGLYREAIQGKDVEDFLNSPAGRFVLGAACQDQQAIEEQLTRVKPWRKRRITELQCEHRAVTLAIEWLTSAVNIGLSSHRELDDANREQD